ncbi:MAG: hypothetical protein WBD87_02590 [Candidatus Acidiferrales bacterium]
MRILKIICILFCLMSVASAITGIQSAHSSMRAISGAPAHVSTIVTRERGTAARLWAIFVALVFAVAAYGIHKRAPFVWGLGWVVLCLAFLQFLIEVLSSSLRLPQPDRWIASSAILLGAGGVAAWWGIWWNDSGIISNSTLLLTELTPQTSLRSG